jgi:hypothetical protein
MTTYDNLVAQHEILHQQFTNAPHSVELAQAYQLVEEARLAGREVSEIPQRQQLRSILRHWGNFIHDRTGEYPNTHLLPYSPATAAPSSPTPTEAAAAAPSESSALLPVADQGAEQAASDRAASRPPWFWPALAAVIIAAVLLALLASAAWNRLTNPDPLTTAVADLDTLASPTAELPGIEGDSDGDGLSDQQEALLGTESSNPDTDGDGLSDGEEMLLYGSNPAAPDSDGDGAPDGDEITLETSPTDPGSIPTTSAVAPPIEIYPGATISATASITVTATPTLPEGPRLTVSAAEGQETISLRTGPGEQYAVVVDVAVGTTALIVRRVPDNSWYSIELAGGGVRGWLPATQAIIDETTNIAAVPTFVAP